MNAAVGSEVARDLSHFLRSEPCVAGFDEQLEVANPEGFSALEALTESRGLDDEVLRMIAPAANGEVILALEMSGRLTTGEEEESPPSRSPKPTAPAADPRSPPRGRGSRHAPRAAPRGAPREVVEVPDLQVSASLFSVRLQHSVSSVNMRYSGSSLEDGLRRLAEQLATLFPNAVCRPWDWAHMRVVHEQDSAGLPLPRFHLVRTE
jgi:hypothetical protein